MHSLSICLTSFYIDPTFQIFDLSPKPAAMFGDRGPPARCNLVSIQSGDYGCVNCTCLGIYGLRVFNQHQPSRGKMQVVRVLCYLMFIAYVGKHVHVSNCMHSLIFGSEMNLYARSVSIWCC